ncbi:hypothetical protein VP01_1381g1 [Puccinia sorghi]|uniref:cellulase n=1 Tax=Puccinia sorghi TaxID=27349 RepID=A0A0L6VLY8_9BASI|nr:hypothetical protein VP01_1381g1 [Puccinia sorghi]
MTLKQNTFWQGIFALVALALLSSGAHAEESSVAPAGIQPTDPVLERLVGIINPSVLPLCCYINLPGFEFGVQTDGTYKSDTNPAYPPPDSQISHFIKQGVNFFRVPVGWEYLQAEMNGPLNQTSLKAYQTFVEKITTNGANVAIDLHSFARYKGQIVGESASTPSDVLVDVWLKLGEVFKDNPLVMFGLSNEPHDLNLTKWAATVQKVVTALRTKKIDNILLIPGDDYTSLKAFPKWFPVMKTVLNPDKSHKGLVFEVHRYLDSDNSGTSKECVASRADEVKAAVELLRADGRQVILGETGGGSTDSCKKLLPELIAAVTDAYPVFAGYAIWAAGSFDQVIHHCITNYGLVTTVKDAASVCFILYQLYPTYPTGWKDQGNWMSLQSFVAARRSAKTTATKASTQNVQSTNSGKKITACRRRVRV